MKTSQKGSVTPIVLLVILLIVLVGAGVYMYQHHSTVSEETTTVVTQPANQTADVSPVISTTPSEPAMPPHALPDPITKVYTDKTFGFSATYPKAFTASVDKKSTVTLAIANSGITPFTITQSTNSADTSTGKWGKNILSYGKNSWVTQLQNEQDGSVYTAVTVPFAYTASGLPIFTGGTRHGFGLSVYVVALSQTKFLIITGGEGLTNATGYDLSTDPTLKIAKTVTLLK